MEIIIPAAGLSTRFPNLPPKYVLVDKSGSVMLERAIAPYIGIYPITLVLLDKHINNYPREHEFLKKYNNIKIITLQETTKGPADTVYRAIQKLSCSFDSKLFVKDCDSFFNHSFSYDNFVCFSSVQSNRILTNLAGKSFIKTNNQNIITTIIEKQVISNKFCVGGYGFESINFYCKKYDEIDLNNVKEIFVSHVIQQCLKEKIFLAEEVTSYTDVGTIQEWQKYNESEQ
jgi:hypothetical protein